MEGKNCFRTVWTQQPLYSGGHIATLLLDPLDPMEGDEAARNGKELCVAMGCGNTLHIVHAETGEVRTSFTLPTDDVILSLDAVTLGLHQQRISRREDSSQDVTQETKKRRRESSAQHEGEFVVDSEEGGEGVAVRRVGCYIAFGTRALQLYVVQVEAVTASSLNDSAENKQSSNATGEAVNESQSPSPSSLDPAEAVGYRCVVVKQWTASQQAISCVCFSSNAEYLVSGSSDGGVKVWNVFHHHLTHNLRCPSATLIQSVFLSGDDKYLVTGTFEGHVTVFDLELKQVLATSRPHVQAVEALTLRLPDLMVYSVARDRKLAVMQLNAKRKSLEDRKAVVVKEQVSAASFEGHTLLHTGSLDGIITTYAVSAEGALTKQIQLPKPAASNAEDRTEESTVMCIRPKLAVKGTEGWWQPHSSPGYSPLCVADAGFNIHCVSQRDEPHASACSYYIRHTIVGFLDQVLEIKCLPPALPYQRLVVNNSKDVRLYDGSGCLSSRCLRGHADIVMCAAVSTDGQLIATGGKDMEVRFWSTETWETVGRGTGGHTAEITGMRFNAKQSEDYLVLFTIAADENLRLWDAGKHIVPLLSGQDSGNEESAGAVVEFSPRSGINAAHAGPVYAIEVAPNDQYVATGGKDKTIHLWTINGKKIYREGVLKGHRRAVTSLAFSSADRVLASASNDGSVRLWSLTSLTCIKTLQADKTAVLQLALFNYGTQLVTTNAEGVVRVWAVGAGEVVWSSELHDEKVWALAVHESGSETVFYTGAADGVVVATEDCTEEEVQRVREEREDIILKEQDLANRIRKGDFKGAFSLALRLDHPRHLRQVVEKWMAVSASECETTLQQEILPSLSEPLLLRLLQFIREWLTNSRHAAVASVSLRAFLSSKHLEDVARMGAMRQLVEPLLAYSRKHSQRVHEMVQRTYYVDYVTRALTPHALSTTPAYVTS